jgi:hypothetical protein
MDPDAEFWADLAAAEQKGEEEVQHVQCPHSADDASAPTAKPMTALQRLHQKMGAFSHLSMKKGVSFWKQVELDKLCELDHCVGNDPDAGTCADEREGRWLYCQVCNLRRVTQPSKVGRFVAHCTNPTNRSSHAARNDRRSQLSMAMCLKRSVSSLCGSPSRAPEDSSASTSSGGTSQSCTASDEAPTTRPHTSSSLCI